MVLIAVIEAEATGCDSISTNAEIPVSALEIGEKPSFDSFVYGTRLARLAYSSFFCMNMFSANRVKIKKPIPRDFGKAQSKQRE
jgi:hypothetical protein